MIDSGNIGSRFVAVNEFEMRSLYRKCHVIAAITRFTSENAGNDSAVAIVLRDELSLMAAELMSYDNVKLFRRV